LHSRVSDSLLQRGLEFGTTPTSILDKPLVMPSRALVMPLPPNAPLFVADGGPFPRSPISRPFKHYACTPSMLLPSGSYQIGAPMDLVMGNMKQRASHFVGDVQVLTHEDRVYDPAAAAAHFVWTSSTPPWRDDLKPCCGCGVPTPRLCECNRSFFCEQCAGHQLFSVGLVIQCRKCVSDYQQRLGLR